MYRIYVQKSLLLKQVTEEFVVLKEIKYHLQRFKREHIFLKDILGCCWYG